MFLGGGGVLIRTAWIFPCYHCVARVKFNQ